MGGEKRQAGSAHLRRRSNFIPVQYSGNNHNRSSSSSSNNNNNDNNDNVIQLHPDRSGTASSTFSSHRVLQDNGGGSGSNHNNGGGNATGPGPGGSAFVETMLFFGFMFALAFLIWTLLRFGCNAFRSDQPTRTAEDELRLRGSLPAPHSGSTSRVSGNNNSRGGGNLIVSRRTQELTAAQKRERRAFLENVLVNESYRVVGDDPSSTTHATPTSNACAICLEEYQKGDRITKSFNSRCNHVFHRQCALQWFLSLQGNDDACPCCRQNFLQFDDDDDDNNHHDGHHNYNDSYAANAITAGLGEHGDSTAASAAAAAAISPSPSFDAENRAAFPAQQQQMAPPSQVNEAVYLQALHDLVDEDTSVVATTTTTTTTPTTGIAAAAEPAGVPANARPGIGYNYSHGPVATTEGVSISGMNPHSCSIPRPTMSKSTLYGDETYQQSDLTSRIEDPNEKGRDSHHPLL